MSRVKCQIEEVELENDNGYMVDGVCATCSRCDHETESFGTSDASRKRCLVLLREECPKRERNFYVIDDKDDKLSAWEEAEEAAIDKAIEEDTPSDPVFCCNPKCENHADYMISDVYGEESVAMCLECTKVFILKEVEDAKATSG